jgi:hypothetical protein
VVKLVAAAKGFGPLAKFLGPPAVKGILPVTKGQSQIGGCLFKTCDHLRDILVLTCKKFLKGTALFRGFRMQGKSGPGDIQFQF